MYRQLWVCRHGYWKPNMNSLEEHGMLFFIVFIELYIFLCSPPFLSSSTLSWRPNSQFAQEILSFPPFHADPRMSLLGCLKGLGVSLPHSYRKHSFKLVYFSLNVKNIIQEDFGARKWTGHDCSRKDVLLKEREHVTCRDPTCALIRQMWPCW